MKSLIAIIFAVLALSGCATSSVGYTPPIQQPVLNTRHIDKSFELVWDGLVKQLSSDFFVINNIDKSSRLINISFSSGQPSKYVDCGSTTRSMQDVAGTHEQRYRTSDSVDYKHANQFGEIFFINRVTKLEGRANIYVAPENNGTQLTVNAKYVVSVVAKGHNVYGRPVGFETATFDLSTKQGYSSPLVQCYTTGAVENEILSFSN